MYGVMDRETQHLSPSFLGSIPGLPLKEKLSTRDPRIA